MPIQLPSQLLALLQQSIAGGQGSSEAYQQYKKLRYTLSQGLSQADINDGFLECVVSKNLANAHWEVLVDAAEIYSQKNGREKPRDFLSRLRSSIDSDHDGVHWAIFSILEKDLTAFNSTAFNSFDYGSPPREPILCKTNFDKIQQLANGNNRIAQYLLGRMCEVGYAVCGVKQDFQRAERYYQLAAEQGLDVAKIALARLLKNAKKYSEAVAILQPLVEQENPQAQYEFATLLESGFGVDRDKKAALSYLILSAEQGYAPAQQTLGLLFYGVRGSGVRGFDSFPALQNALWNEYGIPCDAPHKNKEKSLYYFKLASDHGSAESQCCLGRYHELRVGDALLKRDMFRDQASASKENKEQINELENIVQNSLEKAIEYYALAIRSKDDPAEQLLWELLEQCTVYSKRLRAPLGAVSSFPLVSKVSAGVSATLNLSYLEPRKDPVVLKSYRKAYECGFKRAENFLRDHSSNDNDECLYHALLSGADYQGNLDASGSYGDDRRHRLERLVRRNRSEFIQRVVNEVKPTRFAKNLLYKVTDGDVLNEAINSLSPADLMKFMKNTQLDDCSLRLLCSIKSFSLESIETLLTKAPSYMPSSEEIRERFDESRPGRYSGVIERPLYILYKIAKTSPPVLNQFNSFIQGLAMKIEDKLIEKKHRNVFIYNFICAFSFNHRDLELDEGVHYKDLAQLCVYANDFHNQYAKDLMSKLVVSASEHLVSLIQNGKEDSASLLERFAKCHSDAMAIRCAYWLRLFRVGDQAVSWSENFKFMVSRDARVFADLKKAADDGGSKLAAKYVAECYEEGIGTYSNKAGAQRYRAMAEGVAVIAGQPAKSGDGITTATTTTTTSSEYVKKQTSSGSPTAVASWLSPENQQRYPGLASITNTDVFAEKTPAATGAKPVATTTTTTTRASTATTSSATSSRWWPSIFSSSTTSSATSTSAALSSASPALPHYQQPVQLESVVTQTPPPLSYVAPTPTVPMADLASVREDEIPQGEADDVRLLVDRAPAETAAASSAVSGIITRLMAINAPTTSLPTSNSVGSEAQGASTLSSTLSAARTAVSGM